MRPFFIMSLLFCFHSFGQNLAIDDRFYTINAAGQYDVFLEGSALFTDSMRIVYTVTTADTLQQLLFSDTVDFSADTVVYPESFTYSANDSTLHIALGTYPVKSLILLLYSEVEGNRIETIYINIPTFEAVLENEE